MSIHQSGYVEGLLRAVCMLAALIGLQACAPQHDNATKTLRIGYQKWSTFSILKTSGTLAQAFKPKGIQIEWFEFASGPPLFERWTRAASTLATVAIHRRCSHKPPISRSSTFAISSSSPDSSAILLKRDSSMQGAKDLRGRWIGFTKGSSAHTLVLRYLQKNGLSLSDITPVYLPPADGRAALETGSIDAWAIWDPYLAAAQQAGGNRSLTTGLGYVGGREFYFAPRRLVQEQPELVSSFLLELEQMNAWTKANADQVNRSLSAVPAPLPAVELAEPRPE